MNEQPFTPLRLLHMDLGEKLSALPAAADAHGIFAVLWLRGMPLGQMEIPPEHLPMGVPDLANRVAQAITPAVAHRLFPNDPGNQLNAADPERVISAERPLQQLLPIPSIESPVSVVVCTRNRPEPLRRCLFSIEKLNPAPAEIIVVDNASSTDEIERLVREEFPRVRYVREPRPGLDIARNTGASASRCKIVAFADDDVEVHPAWITEVCKGFADPEVMAVTGLVLPAELETAPQDEFEKWWGFNRGYRAQTFGRAFFDENCRDGVPADQLGAGANMAFRREIFEEIGGFDERLDVGAAGCSGDSEYWYRILASGFKCRYEPAAVVFHHHRRDPGELDRQIYYYMRGHAAALLIQWEQHGHLGNLRRLLWTLPRYYLKLLFARLTRPSPLTRGWWPQVSGYCSGIWFYLQHRRAA